MTIIRYHMEEGGGIIWKKAVGLSPFGAVPPVIHFDLYLLFYFCNAVAAQQQETLNELLGGLRLAGLVKDVVALLPAGKLQRGPGGSSESGEGASGSGSRTAASEYCEVLRPLQVCVSARGGGLSEGLGRICCAVTTTVSPPPFTLIRRWSTSLTCGQ